MTGGAPARRFPFVQFEFAFPLGPADGRYVTRAATGGDPERVGLGRRPGERREHHADRVGRGIGPGKRARRPRMSVGLLRTARTSRRGPDGEAQSAGREPLRVVVLYHEARGVGLHHPLRRMEELGEEACHVRGRTS